MAAGIHNFEIEQGGDFARTLVWKEDGGPQDLTGYTAKLDIRAATGALIITLSTTNGRIVLGGPAGTITLSIPNADTATLPPTDDHAYAYDLKLTSSGGTITRLLRGKVKVSAQVTQ